MSIMLHACRYFYSNVVNIMTDWFLCMVGIISALETNTWWGVQSDTDSCSYNNDLLTQCRIARAHGATCQTEICDRSPEDTLGTKVNESLKGFTFYNYPRKYRHPNAKRDSSGISIFVRDDIKHGVVIWRNTEDVVAWIELKAKYFGLKRDLYVANIYIWCHKGLSM